MSADARRWWPAPSDVRLTGGRSDDEPSGVLLRLAMWLDMAAVEVEVEGEVEVVAVTATASAVADSRYYYSQGV